MSQVLVSREVGVRIQNKPLDKSNKIIQIEHEDKIWFKQWTKTDSKSKI